MATVQTEETRYVSRPEGRIAYDVAGNGPLVVLVPGMGDLRGAYRFVSPQLRAADYKVACTDLRGHGESDATFSSYGDIETAEDVMVPEAGHYPQSQRPDVTTGAVLGFLKTLEPCAEDRPHSTPSA